MRTPEQRLADILDAVRVAEEIVAEGRAAFEDSIVLQYAATQAIARAGEAAKALPEDVLDAMPTVSWRRMKGMRDRLTHDYPNIDLVLVWNALAQELPPAAHAIREYLRGPTV